MHVNLNVYFVLRTRERNFSDNQNKMKGFFLDNRERMKKYPLRIYDKIIARKKIILIKDII